MHRSMFSSTDGKLKCLPIIWNKFSHWSNTNTIHVDDLERNFQLNKCCGIVIPPYNREDSSVSSISDGLTSASSSSSSNSSCSDRSGDIELLLLARYLVEISDVPGPSDLEANVHKDWRDNVSRKIIAELSVSSKANQRITDSLSLPSPAALSSVRGGGEIAENESILRQIISSSTTNKQFFIDIINKILQNAKLS